MREIKIGNGNEFTVKMIGSIILSCVLSLLFVSCGVSLTVQEFKQKYDWDTSVVTYYGYDRGSPAFKFEYNGVIYNVRSYNSLDVATLGDRFKVLFNKAAPDDDFLILLYEPIKPKPIRVITTYGQIKEVALTDHQGYVRYEFYENAVSYGFFSKEKKTKYKAIKRWEAVDLIYLDKLKLLKVSGEKVRIDLYVTEVTPANTGTIVAYLCLDEL